MMKTQLTVIEARVLGVFLEKSMATPEYYPLTLNAATNACNQKSNREPVMALSESEVQDALMSLIQKHYVSARHTQGSRVQKYSHRLADAFIEKYMFDQPTLSILCILLLRGAQTLGEIRTRTSRLYAFESLEEVQSAINTLIQRDDGPYVTLLPREAGRREQRYMHLMCGKEAIQATSDSNEVLSPSPLSEPRPPSAVASSMETRLAALEQRVTRLEHSLADLLD